jgi:cephalosporin hydroxylase
MHENIYKIARKNKPVKDYLKHFLVKYEEIFEEIRYEKMNILEIGVGGYKKIDKGGGSLKMWSEYFSNSNIIGVDLHNKEIDFSKNVNFHMGSQTDVDFLKKIHKTYGDFDIVIDDASHITEKTIITFEALYPHTLKYYVVEDLHMAKAKGTREYFEKIKGSDFETLNLCIVSK